MELKGRLLVAVILLAVALGQQANPIESTPVQEGVPPLDIANESPQYVIEPPKQALPTPS
jgi:hypothetical protein